LFFLFVATLSTNEWLTNMEKARQQAVKENKIILLNFSGSDWCGPCIRMKREIFESDLFESFAAEHLLLVKADFPRGKKNKLSAEQTRKNEALAERYNPDGKFPFTVLLDSSGKVLKSWDGFPDQSPAVFVEEIKPFVHVGG